MKEKIILTLTALAITFTTAKTGYAYYQNTIKSETQTVTGRQSVGNTYTSFEQTKSFESLATDNTAKNDSYSNTKRTFNGCGNGYGIMMDEYGNFKDRNVLENDLNELIEQGQISEADKDYYLSLYDRCQSAYNNYDSQLNDESAYNNDDENYSGYPSCH